MKKIFDLPTAINKATVIDCMDCEHYYTGACDGRAGGCDSYTPTRKITLEKDIRDIKALCKFTATLVLTGYLAYCISLLSLLIAK